MSIALDPGAIDMATMVVAVVAIFFRPLRRKITQKHVCFTQRDCIVDFLNGATIVPFLTLIVGPFVDSLINSNKLQMAIAGVIGLIFVIRELLAP